MMNFLQRPALRGFRITERRTQASGNGHTVADRTEVTDTAFHWPLRFPIAALLLFAAAAKVVNAPIILAGDGLLASRPLLLAAIAFEAAAGMYLLIGNERRAWLLALGTFSVLAASAGYAVVAGKDCNCIAKQISPHFMLVLDVAVLLLALWFRPTRPSAAASAPAAPVQSPNELSQLRATKRTKATTALVCSTFAALFAGVATARLAVQFTDDSLDYLIADQLIGKRWPIDSRYHPDLKALESGRWMVLIVRPDCEHCQELISDHFPNPHWHRPNERTAMFAAHNGKWAFQFDTIALNLSGHTAIHWRNDPYFASPVVCLLDDGAVVDSASGGDASGFIAQAELQTAGDVVPSE